MARAPITLPTDGAILQARINDLSAAMDTVQTAIANGTGGAGLTVVEVATAAQIPASPDPNTFYVVTG